MYYDALVHYPSQGFAEKWLFWSWKSRLFAYQGLGNKSR